MLENRKKNQKESLIEYFYSMTALANQSKLDEESIIEYIVEGIPDSKQNKSCLYQASNLKEFHEKLKVYEKICASQGFKPKPNVRSRSTAPSHARIGVRRHLQSSLLIFVAFFLIPLKLSLIYSATNL